MSRLAWVLWIVGIPLNIACGLAVPIVQRWWAERSLTSREKKLKKLKDEYNDVIDCALKPELMIANFVLTGTYMTLLVLMFTIATFIMPIIFTVLDALVGPIVDRHHAALLQKPIFISVELVALTPMTLLFCFELIKFLKLSQTYHKVKYLKSYVKRLPDGVRDAGMEELVENAVLNRAVPGAFMFTGRPSKDDSASSKS